MTTQVEAEVRAREFIEARHFPEFLKRHVWITDATSQATIRWEWWPVHEKMSDDLTRRLLVVLKNRQMSWSWLLAGYADHGCTYSENYTVIVLSQGQDYANEFIRKCRVVYEHLPEWMKGKLEASNSEGMVFANGSSIHAMPATENAGRSFTASLIITDEAAFHPYAAANYAAYKPAIDAGGQLIIVSTANGMGNFFQRMYQSAKDGMSGFEPRFYSWRVRPGRDQGWYDRTYAELEAVGRGYLMAQEYPDNDVEAFLVTGNPRFDIGMMQEGLRESREPLERRLLPERLQRIPGLSVWQLPQPGQPYVMGSDGAQGLGDGDFDCTEVVNANTLTHVAELHGKWEPDYFGEISAELGMVYNRALWGVENAPQGHGHTILATAKRLEYPRLYWHQLERNRHQVLLALEASSKLGWPTTESTKPGLIDDLASAIATGRLHSWSKDFWGECMSYVVDERGRTNASKGMHDDRPMAMAIARRMAMQPGATRVISLVPMEYGLPNGRWEI